MLRPPNIGLVIDLPRLGEPRPSLKEVVQIAKTINREAGLALLARINLLLAVAGIQDALDDEPDNVAVARVQGMLVRDTVSAKRLAQMKRRLGTARLSENLVFHRLGVLASIKLVALFGRSTQGNRLESRTDLEVLCDLLLAVNSLMGEEYADGQAGLLALAAHLGAMTELDRFPRVDYAFVRSRDMMGPILRAHDKHPGARHLEDRFVFLSQGFSFDAYRDMAFALFAYCQSLSTQSVIDFQDRALLNPYGPASSVSGSLFEQFLSNLAVDFGEVPGAVGSIRDERELLLDTLPFRRRPVWRMSKEHYLCVDPYFVVEKLAAGFYWAVNAALDTEESRYDFSSLWGALVEDHVIRILQYAIPIPPSSSSRVPPARVIANPFYSDRHEEAFDAVVLEGQHAVVFQVKGLFVRAAAKYSGQARMFYRGISKSFGNQRGGALDQLVRNVRLTFAIPRLRRMSRFAVGDVRCVWPVVIVLDPILDFGIVTGSLVERFARRLSNTLFQLDTTIRPAMFLQVQDLEVMAEHILAGDFTLVECLRAKLTEDPEHRHSFRHFYWGQFVPERGLVAKRNMRIQTEYSAMEAEAMERFETGAYTDVAVTAFGTVFKRV